MDETESSVQPRNIVYLFGAGATQGELDAHGFETVNVLMDSRRERGEGISPAILAALGPKWPYVLPPDATMDVEKLVSLLAASGIPKLEHLADDLRSAYVDEIQRRLRSTPVVNDPKLATALLYFHSDGVLSRSTEKLTGLLTTNHDGLLQVAIRTVYRAVNIGFTFQSRDFRDARISPKERMQSPPLLQLHGSFTWRFGRPLRVTMPSRVSRHSRDMVWIPPTTLKEAKRYPFPKLFALAYELLVSDCDVLRVIGASMTQNDWNILSLVFNAQQHRRITGQTEFIVELIMPQAAGVRLVESCSYLQRLAPIGSLSDGSFSLYAESEERHTAEMKNPFKYWLTQKVHFHHSRGEVSDELFRDRLAPVVGESP